MISIIMNGVYLFKNRLISRKYSIISQIIYIPVELNVPPISILFCKNYCLLDFDLKNQNSATLRLEQVGLNRNEYAKLKSAGQHPCPMFIVVKAPPMYKAFVKTGNPLLLKRAFLMSHLQTAVCCPIRFYWQCE
jgi:hypothetical protein